MKGMIRGTTPTHNFVLPIETEMVQAIQIIYAQKGETVLTKGKGDCTFDGNSVSVKLTQQETFMFSEDEYVEIQIRVLTPAGDALASHIMRVHCDECLSNEVLQ
jgi:hypothetical protein